MPNDRKALIDYAHAILKRQEEISTLFGNEILLRQEQIANRFERKMKYHEYQIGDFGPSYHSWSPYREDC
jgi:predicted Ser/Thr protein kinase